MRRSSGSVLLFLVIVMSGCSRAQDPWATARPNQKKVLVSFPALYCLTANVAGEHAKVMCLTTAEGPHDYAPTNTDALKVAGADMFIFNGLELDEGACKRLKRMARTIDLVEVVLGEEMLHELLLHISEDDEAHKGHAHHHHGDHDPHIWLGVPQARHIVGVIAKKLGELDPAHKDDFLTNAMAYDKKLVELEAYGREKFKANKSNAIITTHESLAYFAKNFGLKVVAAIQLQPGNEGDHVHRARVIALGKKANVAAIAIEPQYRKTAVADLVLALEGPGRKVNIVEVDPLETAPPHVEGNPRPEFYLETMKQNIDALAKALQ